VRSASRVRSHAEDLDFQGGPLEILVVKEARDPEPAAVEMRIRVEASGVNFAVRRRVLATASALTIGPPCPASVEPPIVGGIAGRSLAPDERTNSRQPNPWQPPATTASV
jgi:hypothetical protein